jgi:hypothetical protein
MSVIRIITILSTLGAAPAQYDSDAQAFINAAGISNLTQKEAINQLVLDLKSAGIWNRMVAVYPFIGGTTLSHKWNLKDARDIDAAKRLVFAGGWTHSETGVLPDGATGYANTFIDFNQDVPQYSLHGSYYSRTIDAPGAGDYYLFGVAVGGQVVGLETYSTNRYYAVVADTAKSIVVTGQTTFKKLLGISCYHFDEFRIYNDGAVIGSNTGIRTGYFPSTDPANTNKLYLGAYNNSGTPLFFSSRECAFASFGYGLDSTQWAALDTAVTNFNTTLGRAIL